MFPASCLMTARIGSSSYDTLESAKCCNKGVRAAVHKPEVMPGWLHPNLLFISWAVPLSQFLAAGLPSYADVRLMRDLWSLFIFKQT